MDNGTLNTSTERLLLDRLSWGRLLHYNPAVTVDELLEDVGRWKSIRRQLALFSTSSKTFNIRLLLNHLIIWFNTFGASQDAVDFLFDGLTEQEKSYLLPFIDYLQIPTNYTIARNESLKQLLKTI